MLILFLTLVSLALRRRSGERDGVRGFAWEFNGFKNTSSPRPSPPFVAERELRRNFKDSVKMRNMQAH